MKRSRMLLLGLVLMTLLFSGCNNSGGSSSEASGTQEPEQEITVVAREASSGTRGAFDELMSIRVSSDGAETDMLFAEAVIVDSSDAVVTKVEVDPFAIGYTSLGSLHDGIKALKIDSVAATVENVKSGQYGIARPFVLATKGEASDLAADFLSFVLSKQGQEIVTEKGFITAVDDAKPYNMPSEAWSGSLSLGGSTSVEKVVEKLREEYIKLHPQVKIEVQYNGSGTGIKDCTAGSVDIAMSSRALKESEKEALQDVTFAHDGIAVIVHKDNPLQGLTGQQVTDIFTGQVRTWEGVK